MTVDLSDLPHFLPYKKVAEVLGVTLLTVRQIVARGELRRVRFGPRTLRVARNSLAAFMAGEHGVAPALPPLPHAIDMAETADVLGVSIDVIRDLIGSGDLKSFPVGHLVRISRDDLARLVAQRTEGASSTPE